MSEEYSISKEPGWINLLELDPCRINLNFDQRQVAEHVAHFKEDASNIGFSTLRWVEHQGQLALQKRQYSGEEHNPLMHSISHTDIQQALLRAFELGFKAGATE